MVNLYYTKAEIVPNKTNPDKEPWLSLGYKLNPTDKKEKDFTFGPKKAYYFLRELDNMIAAHEEHANSGDKSFFKYKITIDEGTRFASEVEITEGKFLLIQNYKEDIENYLAEHPFVPFHRTAIPEPKVVMEERGIEYVSVLYLPCWEKGPEDDGEGLVPKKLTQSNAKFLMTKACGGQVLQTFKKALKDGVEKYVDKYVTNTGETIPTEYDKATMNCIVKYRNLIQEFIISGSITLDEE